MRFTVTPEDFLKGGLVELGWHPAQIVSWDESGVAGPTAKNPGSQLIKVKYRITAGQNKDREIYGQFSEVAPTFMLGLLEALAGKAFDKTQTANIETSQASMEGKLVDIHLIPAVYNGKPKREVDAWRPYTGPQA